MLIVLGRVYMPKKDLVIYSAKQNEGFNLSFFLPECIHQGLLSESPIGKEYFCALLWVGAPPAGHQATYRFSSGHQLVTLLFQFCCSLLKDSRLLSVTPLVQLICLSQVNTLLLPVYSKGCYLVSNTHYALPTIIITQTVNK